ncbi:SDR family NAD(P)-dependent oxidoreductase, partial [bacterium]|nr:SDR family NAD(P)-dependent oxidoreductase [bacterium]
MADKTVLLAGASGSIGNDLVPMFSKDTLVLHSHKHDPTCEGEFHTKADINKYEDVDRMVSAILEEFGRIDVLVNVTGVSIDSFAHKADPEVWKS